MVGVLYDNVNPNTGDVAIGISVKKMLDDFGIDHVDGVGDVTIVGGGHILRPSPDPFYDTYRLKGSHILNAAGIVGFPMDLHYLKEYKYVTVRSHGDRKKIGYIPNVEVVPCTTMIIEGAKNVRSPKEGSIGIHVFPEFFKEDEQGFIHWASKLPYTIYFIPITFYNYDYVYMERLSMQISNSIILPCMNPEEIFSFIGQLEFFISCSLHGAIFSYRNNVPFILLDTEKMRFFMEDRGLQEYLFRDLGGMKRKFIHPKKDYSRLIQKDMDILKEHFYRIKQLI